MRLIGRELLESLGGLGSDTAKWVTVWTAEIREAHWKRPNDIARQFPKVSQQTDGSFLFRVPRSQVGVQVLITFSYGIVLIRAIKAIGDVNGR